MSTALGLCDKELFSSPVVSCCVVADAHPCSAFTGKFFLLHLLEKHVLLIEQEAEHSALWLPAGMLRHRL